MVNPMQMIAQHIEELDKDLKSIIPGRPFEQWQVYAALMQAKSTALVALAQAEANAISLKYSAVVNVDEERFA